MQRVWLNLNGKKLGILLQQCMKRGVIIYNKMLSFLKLLFSPYNRRRVEYVQ